MDGSKGRRENNEQRDWIRREEDWMGERVEEKRGMCGWVLERKTVWLELWKEERDVRLVG